RAVRSGRPPRRSRETRAAGAPGSGSSSGSEGTDEPAPVLRDAHLDRAAAAGPAGRGRRSPPPHHAGLARPPRARAWRRPDRALHAAGVAAPPGSAPGLRPLRRAADAAETRARSTRARGRTRDAARSSAHRRHRPAPSRDGRRAQGPGGDAQVKRVARPQTRMGVVAGVFAGLFALLVVRAVDLAVLRGPALARLAAMQHRQRIELMPHRGPIVDRNGESLALSVDVPSVYLRPREFRGQEARIPALAAALHVPARAVRAKIDRGQPFVWLARHVLPREAEAVERLALRGVYTVAEARRFYPHGSLAAHVLGFVGVDSQGLE